MAKTPQWQEWEQRTWEDPDLPKDVKEARIRMLPMLGFNRYIPYGIWPSKLQYGFLMRQEMEVLLGGERRAGKTIALLLDNIRYTTIEGFTSIFFRTTENELKRKNGIIDTLHHWLLPFPEWTYNVERMEFRNSKYDSALVCTFLKEPKDQELHLGYEYWRQNYEELTRFPFEMPPYEDFNAYFWLMSSLDVPPGVLDWLDRPILPRLNSTSNPGGLGEPWVMDHFLSEQSYHIPVGIHGSYMKVVPARPDPHPDTEEDFTPEGIPIDHGHDGKCFIHAMTRDNPGKDHKRYRRNMRPMKEKDPVAFAQLGEGQWGVAAKGGVFDINKLIHVDFAPDRVEDRVRSWDKAATEGGTGARSAGILISRIDPAVARALWGDRAHNVHYVIEHGIAGRWSPEMREDVIDIIAMGSRKIHAYWLEEGRRVPVEASYLPSESGVAVEYSGDGPYIKIYHEQEGGGGGKNDARITTNRLILMRFMAEHQTAGVNKVIRARQFAAAVNNGMVAIVDNGSWMVSEYIKELSAFPKGMTVDFVDASSLGFNNLVIFRAAQPARAGAARQIADGFTLQKYSTKRKVGKGKYTKRNAYYWGLDLK